MLAGQPPFAGPTAASGLHQHLVAPAPAAEHLRQGLAKNISEAIRRGLEKAPADRFATVKEFSDALASRGKATSHVLPKRWMIAASALVVLLIALAFAITRQRPLTPLQLGKRT